MEISKELMRELELLMSEVRPDEESKDKLLECRDLIK